MKNFPHQFNDLAKLTSALGVADVLIGGGEAFGDDGVFGEALANASIYTFRNTSLSISDNIAEEKKKALGNQGFRTAARDIRRFFVLSNLIAQDSSSLTQRGRDILNAAADASLRNALWRDAMLQLRLPDTDGNLSHPYRILMRLVADRPGIKTSKLLLALEARDDSPTEYVRILALADLDTAEIIEQLGIGEANARNAVKILPGIAQQVGDISREGKHTFLLSHETSTEDSLIESGEQEYEKTQPQTFLPTPVDPKAISALPDFGEARESVMDLAAAIEMRKRRTIAHHNTVISIAKLLGQSGYTTYERPYDCLGFKQGTGGLLIEVKTLDGSRSDERRQFEKALGQLKGYTFFNVPEPLKSPKLVELVAYSEAPTPDAVQFMRSNSIYSAWPDNDHWLTVDRAGNLASLSPDDLFSSPDV